MTSFEELAKLVSAGEVNIREGRWRAGARPLSLIASDTTGPVVFTLTTSEKKLGMRGSLQLAMKLCDLFADFPAVAGKGHVFRMEEVISTNRLVVNVSTEYPDCIEMMRALVKQPAVGKPQHVR